MKRFIHQHLVRFQLLAILILTLFTGCEKFNVKDIFNHSEGGSGGSSQALRDKADVALDWYKLQLRIILNASPAYSNVASARLFAYGGIALYESIRQGIPHSMSLSESVYQMPDMPEPEHNNGYSWPIAANASLAASTRNFLAGLTDANKASVDSLENAYNQKLKPNMNSKVFERSQAFGRAISQAVFDWSKSDKSDLANAPYTPPVFPGAWQPTPPAFAPAAVPYLGNCRPFLQEHTMGIADPPPFPYSEDPSSDFYKMVKDIYDVSKTESDEQKSIALFWNDVGVGKGYTPPGHAMSILTQVIENEHINLGTAAAAYAKGGMGIWDGLIMVFRSKYVYNLIRPVTYIRNVIDPTWLPLIPTPPHPEYPAAHAYVTSSTMAAIVSVLGDNHSFADHTYDFLGFTPRNFTSFLAVGVESGNSRRFGGIHYLPSINTGIALGQKVGNEIGKIKLVDF